MAKQTQKQRGLSQYDYEYHIAGDLVALPEFLVPTMSALSQLYQLTPMLAFRLDGPVYGKQRHRITATGGAYTPTETRMFEDNIFRCAQLAAEQQGLVRPVSRPVFMVLIIGCVVPDGVQRRIAAGEKMQGFEFIPHSKPDRDNISKSVADGCEKIVYDSDCRAFGSLELKVYGDKAYVHALFFEASVGD